MATVQKSFRIPEDTMRQIEELGAESGQDFTATANQLLEEALRMRRCPGIVFTSGPTGRRATVAGTGIDVSEIVAAHRSLRADERRLRNAYHWLTEAQLRSALAYYERYPQDIDRRLQRNDGWTPASVRARHPALTSRQPRRAVRRR